MKASKAQYEVLEFIDDEERHYVVDLKKFECDCGPGKLVACLASMQWHAFHIVVLNQSTLLMRV